MHSSWTWWDTAFVRAISPWHAEHSFGVVGGFGSCGLWQLAQALSGLWATGLICGKCHAKDARDKMAKNAPKVDLGTHGEKYVCWQCHYPHSPEVE